MRYSIILATGILMISSAGVDAADENPTSPPGVRSTFTDEPRAPKGKPKNAADYVPKVEPSDGQHLALTMQKLVGGIDPPRPFLIWALGSSYTNMLGNGEAWKAEIPKRFPNAPPIEYRKMVGNSCPWQYLRGWARQLAIPDQPDLVLIYTIGNPADLEKLIVELRTQTTADIIVPSIHWRERDQELWGISENAKDQDVSAVRDICRKYDVEFVESRRQWGEYLKANQLPIPALLKDAVHQSEYGAQIINANILAHLQKPETFSYDPLSRERRIQPTKSSSGSLSARFVGNRIDLIGEKSADGGTFQVHIDGQEAERVDAFVMSYVQPDPKNAKEGKGANPRDQSPHGITLGENIVPQTWTLVVSSDDGDYKLTGSITGPDGNGNAFQPFTSRSGQIEIDPELWRRAERNRTGDRFTFEVRRAVVPEISFAGKAGERFVVRVAQMLPNQEHVLELVPSIHGDAKIEALEVFEPPLK